jgi:hypothetical protein
MKPNKATHRYNYDYNTSDKVITYDKQAIDSDSIRGLKVKKKSKTSVVTKLEFGFRIICSARILEVNVKCSYTAYLHINWLYRVGTKNAQWWARI